MFVLKSTHEKTKEALAEAVNANAKQATQLDLKEQKLKRAYDSNTELNKRCAELESSNENLIRVAGGHASAKEKFKKQRDEARAEIVKLKNKKKPGKK